MDEAKPYIGAVRDFVSNGGRYIGFCLGAYMSGHDPGFSLIPAGDDVSDEIDEPGSQVKNDNDTIIQVDWTFSTGKKAGTTEKKRWVYFQDGAVFTLGDDSPAKVLATYSSDGNVAAMLNQFGKGWVANVGPHPEANQDWCKFSVSLTCGGGSRRLTELRRR